MATLPKAVQQQLAQAEAVQAQLVAEQTPVIVTDASQLEPAAPEPAPAPPAPPTPPAPADTTDWKNKALTLEGMLRSQVPELKTQLTIAQSQVAQYAAQLEEARRLAARAPDPEPAKPTVDPRDVEQFGTDMMDMVQRYVTGAVDAIRKEVAALTTSVESRVQALEQSVNGVSQKAEASLQTQFWATLEKLVPDYEQLNELDAWKAWLQERDPLTGVERQQALIHAQRANDAVRVAEIFKVFKQTLPPSPAAELASQVSPGTGGAAPAVAAPAAPQLISEKFIHSFYRDVQRGKYVGREAEAARIEQQITQAAAQGRIVR